MGTKNNPGEFDCYANAKPDEPMFVLLARDNSAPSIVYRWATKYMESKGGFENMSLEQFKKFKEARECADKMADWKRDNPNV